MRYLLLGGVSVLSMILTACVSPQVSIFGAQMDMLLAVLLGMVAWEQTMTPVFYVTLAAMWMDAFFAKALGFYALQYLLVGMGLCLFLKDRRLDIVGVMLTAAGAWVLRASSSASSWMRQWGFGTDFSTAHCRGCSRRRC